MREINSTRTPGTLEQVRFMRRFPLVVSMTARVGIDDKITFQLQRFDSTPDAHDFMYGAMARINEIIDNNTVTTKGDAFDFVAHAVQFAVKTYGDCGFSITVSKEGEE